RGFLAMPTVRMLLEGRFRWAGVIGWALLFCVATGCVGTGHPAADTAVERILAPSVGSGQPGTAAAEPVTGVTERAGGEAVEGRPRENESTPEREQNRLPPPKPPALPDLPPPGEPPHRATPGGPATGTVVRAGVPGRPLGLPEAIALAFQLQPRLRSAL